MATIHSSIGRAFQAAIRIAGATSLAATNAPKATSRALVNRMSLALMIAEHLVARLAG